MKQPLSRRDLIELAGPMPPFIPALQIKIRRGEKTQTRRVIDPQPSAGVRVSVFVNSGYEDGHGRELKPKYPGGVRYLRETLEKDRNGYARYQDSHMAFDPQGNPIKWRWKKPVLSQIFMPKDAARFFFNWGVQAIQQVQYISDKDIAAEGIKPTATRRAQFIDLWDGINAKRGFGFDVNPYVWVYEFHKYNLDGETNA